MISISTKVTTDAAKVARAANKAAFKNFRHAAAAIRKTAVEMVTPSDKPSAPGSPPHTRLRVSKKSGKRRKGQLKRSVVYDADDKGAVIGPRESVMGTSMVAHEFGGTYKGQQFDKRPLMAPALEANRSRIVSNWRDSIVD